MPPRSCQKPLLFLALTATLHVTSQDQVWFCQWWIFPYGTSWCHGLMVVHALQEVLLEKNSGRQGLGYTPWSWFSICIWPEQLLLRQVSWQVSWLFEIVSQPIWRTRDGRFERVRHSPGPNPGGSHLSFGLENTPTLTDLTDATLLFNIHTEILSSLQGRLAGEPWKLEKTFSFLLNVFFSEKKCWLRALQTLYSVLTQSLSGATEVSENIQLTQGSPCEKGSWEQWMK